MGTRILVLTSGLFAAVSSIGHAAEPSIDAELIVLLDDTAFEASAKSFPRDSNMTGFAIGGSRIVYDGVLIKAAPIDRSGNKCLTAGNFLAVRFKPSTDMRVAIYDIDEDGQCKRLSPIGVTKSTEVSGLQDYFLGTWNSDVTIEIETPVKTGVRKLYLSGAVNSEPLNCSGPIGGGQRSVGEYPDKSIEYVIKDKCPKP